mgnify:CR=1 FL=1
MAPAIDPAIDNVRMCKRAWNGAHYLVEILLVRTEFSGRLNFDSPHISGVMCLHSHLSKVMGAGHGARSDTDQCTR